MTQPTELSIYIRLATRDKLDKKYVKLFYQLAKEHLPEGVMHQLPERKPDGEFASASLIHRKGKKAHSYYIPLTRHLTDSEGENLVEIWEDWYPFSNWEIELSSEGVELHGQNTDDNIFLQKNSYDEMCNQISKHLHQCWYHEKSDAGWRWGEKVSHKNKTHPMIKPWEDLPEKWRKVDYDLPRELIKILNKNGYRLIKR